MSNAPGTTPGSSPREIRFIDRNPPEHAYDDVRAALEQQFGLGGELHPLGGERDQNFLVNADNGTRYVLKIANAAETVDAIEFQVGALLHIAIADPELPVPRVIRLPGGQHYARHRFANGSEHLVYLLSYLEGVTADEAGPTFGAAGYKALGAFMARLDIALRGYFHPAAEQDHPWNLAACERLRPLTRHLDTGREKVEAVFDHMSAEVLPRLRNLRHQVIHQDAHTENVLVDTADPDRITGLIDFGDMLYGPLVAEVAIACDSIPLDAPDIVTPASEIVAAFDAVLPLEAQEVDLVFDLVCARNAMTATIASARAALTPDEPGHITSAAKYVERIEKLETVGRSVFSRRLRAACRFPASCPGDSGAALTDKEEDALIASRHRLMGRRTTHFYDRPMHFERGRGPWLYATDGRRYLDCYNNVPQVGHCHPHVVRAISRQAAALNTNTRYLYSNALEYAERLTGTLAPHLTACIFVNSGSEANDVAWQMAKLITGRSGAIIMEDAYHGVTDVIRHFSPGHPDTALPGFLRGLVVPDSYRGPHREDDPQIVEHYSADVDRAIDELDAAGHSTAAFMVDSAFCSSGVPDVPDGYLRAVETKIRAAGGLMICDEVQSGFGRMGQWWGHEHHGVRADIVTMGKPVGNGHPLGVIVTTDEILNRFIDKTRLFSTFGGNTVACAAGNAVLDVIENERLIERGREIGVYMRGEIKELAAKHELIGDVRGHGMVSGLEFVTDRSARNPATRETAALLELMRRNGVLVGSEGRDANILKLRPPLVFGRDHVDVFIGALDRSLAAI